MIPCANKKILRKEETIQSREKKTPSLQTHVHITFTSCALIGVTSSLVDRWMPTSMLTHPLIGGRKRQSLPTWHHGGLMLGRTARN